MTESVGTIFVEITLDDKKYTAQLQAVGQAGEKAGKQIGENISKGAKQATTSFQQMETVVKSLMYKLAVLYSINQLSSFIKETALLASRFETMGIVMNQVAKTAGFTTEAIKEQEMALRKQGITMLEARSNLTKMMQAQIDVTQASKLARIAQDAAVIGNINSSEAFARMIYGIQTGNILILRNIGLQVSNEQAYDKLAKSIGKKTAALTQEERTQARVNAVIQEGIKIQGVYEAAMGTSGKKIQSFVRYVEDYKVKMGEAFGPAMVILIDTATEAMKKMQEEISSPKAQEALKEIANELANVVKILIEEAPAALERVMGLLTGAIKIYNTLPSEVIAGGIGLVGALYFGSNIAMASMIGAIAIYITFMDRVAKFATSKEIYAEKASEGIANSAIVRAINDLDSKNKIVDKRKEIYNAQLYSMKEANKTAVGIARAIAIAAKDEQYSADALEYAKRKGVGTTFDSEAVRFRDTWSAQSPKAEATKEQLKANLDAEKKYYNEAKFDAIDYYDWKKKLIEKERKDNIEKGVSIVTAAKEANQEMLKLDKERWKSLADFEAYNKHTRMNIRSDFEDMSEQEVNAMPGANMADPFKVRKSLTADGELEKYLKDVDTIMEKERAKSELIGQLALMENDSVEKASKEKIDIYQNLYGMLDSKTKESFDFQISLLDKQKESYTNWAKNIKDDTERLKILDLITEAFRQQAEKLKEIQDLKTGDMYAGFTIGVKQWTEEAETAAQGMARVTKKAFNDMTDALTQYVRTGKMDWRSLADSIVDELIRIQIQQALVYAASGGKEGGGGLLGGVLKIAGMAVSAYSGAGAAGNTLANTSIAGGLGWEKGGAFDTGKVIPFAQGEIFNSPTIFPMANGAGVMGEAGPEAVMPLSRGIDGKLGVKNSSNKESSSEGGTNILINAVDAKSFEDLCKRNPAAITGPILQSLRDNKTRTEFKRLVN